jgi:hypothetical protein
MIMLSLAQFTFRWKPVLIAFVLNSLIGHIYYGLLSSFYQEFVKVYHRKKMTELQKSMLKAMVWTYIDSFVHISVLFILIQLIHVRNIQEAATLGFLSWLGFQATRLHVYMFQGLPAGMFLMNTVHDLIANVIIAIVLFSF